MVLRGFLVAASGFLFIFSPGLPIGLLARRSPFLNRDLIYWGIGVWLVTLLPSLFIQSLMRQLVQGSQLSRPMSGQAVDYGLSLVGALIAAVFLQGAMSLVLRSRRDVASDLPPNGMALGFGVGLIAQVFTGLSLVGAGFRLMFGDVSQPALASLAQANYLNLLLGLSAVVLFRPALMVVSAVEGVLVARAIAERWSLWLLAVLIDAIFSWAILALQLALKSENPGHVALGITDPMTSTLVTVYYALAFGLAFRWLQKQVGDWNMERLKRKG